MSQRTVSQSLLALALLASASAVPMMPYAHGLMGYGGAMLGGPFGGAFGAQAGQSYSCGGSFGSCSKPKEDVYKHVYEPGVLVGLQRRLDAQTQTVEGLVAVIEEHGKGRTYKEPKYGGYGQGLGYGTGYGTGYGGGYGNVGFGGYGAFGKGGFGVTGGLMGALGGLSGAFGSYGRQEPPSLDLSLEVLLATLPEPIEVLLVFTKASDRDVCTGETVGPVLTRPPPRDQFSGFGVSLLQHGGFGPGAGQSFEQQFGIISVLTLKQGVNSFSIKGLGDFTSLRDLAGYGIALCEDVVVTGEGKHMCDGKNFGVLFCSSLGFSVDIPHVSA